MDKNPVTRIPLDLKFLSENEMQIWNTLHANIVGQDFAKKILVSRLSNLTNGLSGAITGPKPSATLLFIGPTGSGKMHLIKTLAKEFLGDENGFLRVNCIIFSEGMITQEKIDEPGFRYYAGCIYEDAREAAETEMKMLGIDLEALQKAMSANIKKGAEFDKCNKFYEAEVAKLRKKERAIENKLKKVAESIKWRPGGNYRSVVVFEGIDEAHSGIINVLREILDSGTYTASDGNIVSFRNSIIVLKCNLLSEDLLGDLQKKGTMGFDTKTAETTFDDIYKKAIKKAVESIPSELLKEIGKENIVVFRPFSKDDMLKIIERKLKVLSVLYLDGSDKTVSVIFTDNLKEFIYNETQDSVNKILGASSIERIISLRICNRLNKIIETKGFNICPGDTIEMDVVDKDIVCSKLVT